MRNLSASEMRAVSGGSGEDVITVIGTRPQSYWDRELIKSMLIGPEVADGAYDTIGAGGGSGVQGSGVVDLSNAFNHMLAAISRGLQGAEAWGETSTRNDFNAQDIYRTVPATNPETGESGYYHLMKDGTVWVDTDGDGTPGTHIYLQGGQAWADTDLDGDFETMVPMPLPGA
jgi:hypothetical protein